jgi:GAF domain-containing protein
VVKEQSPDEGDAVMTQGPTTREHQLAATFVSLADTLVNGFDVVGLFDDLAGACVELLDATAAGLMLADPSGRLRVMASSSERSRLLELLEIQNDEGPCLDCYRDGQPVIVHDIVAHQDRWPNFVGDATRVGFGAVYALPMRLRDETIGALNLFHRQPDVVTAANLRLAQALADVATIGILQQRAVKRSADLADQLQVALNSRLIIEQAKGVLAEREHTDMASAFEMLRSYARRTSTRLSDIAAAVVHGELDSALLRPGVGP